MNEPQRIAARLSRRNWLLGGAAFALAGCTQRQQCGPVTAVKPAPGAWISVTDPAIVPQGRSVTTLAQGRRLAYPGSGLRIAFAGQQLLLRAESNTGNSRLLVLLNGERGQVLQVPQKTTELHLITGLPAGEHVLEVVHLTETWQGIVTAQAVHLGPGGRLLAPERFAPPERRTLFIGDSVTSGEGAGRAGDCSTDKAADANAYDSYAMLLARALQAQCHVVSYGGRGLVRDWQGKTDTLTLPECFELAVAEQAGPHWDHTLYTPHLVFVSLGTNDFNLQLGPLPEASHYVSSYVTFLRRIRSVHPEAQVVVTEGAIVNDTTDPARPQKSVLRSYLMQTLQALNDPRIHFLPSVTYPGTPCDAHPTAQQHVAMARDFEPELRRILAW